jgi:hypothetical protein
MSNTEIHLNEVYNLLKALISYWKHYGKTTVYRAEILKEFSRITRNLDASHTATTRGDAISGMMEQIATELGGKFTKDLNKNGNAKKGTVRIEF